MKRIVRSVAVVLGAFVVLALGFDAFLGVTQLALSPLFEFFRMYALKRGFLDGYPGLVIAALHAHYVFLKYAKLWELHANVSDRGDES